MTGLLMRNEAFGPRNGASGCQSGCQLSCDRDRGRRGGGGRAPDGGRHPADGYSRAEF
jgi:hypothetical protein